MKNSNGVHPPEPMMHSPCFIFPLFSNKFQTMEKFLSFTFSRKISLFSSTKISDDLFLFIDHKFRNSPLYFPFSVHFAPVLRKLLFPLIHVCRSVHACISRTKRSSLKLSVTKITLECLYLKEFLLCMKAKTLRLYNRGSQFLQKAL